MEKISIQSTYTQVSLYARLSGPTSAKKTGADDAADASGALTNASDPKSGEYARSKDGDTFSLSIEARTLQVTRSITIETGGDGTSDASGNTDKATQAGKTDKASESDRLTGGGLVNALMDALQTISDTVGQGKSGGHGKSGKHHHHFPQLSDPGDVADKLLSGIDQDYAAKGGSKEDFAAEVKKRLAAWNASSPSGSSSAASSSSSKRTVEYQEFRSEVHMRLSAGLESWLGQGGNADAGSASASTGGPDATAGTGSNAGSTGDSGSQALTEI